MIKQLLKDTQRKWQGSILSKGSLAQKTFVFLLGVLRPIYYWDEWLLIKGLKPRSASQQKSIIFFSVHKSASTLVKNTIIELVGPQHLKSLKLSGFLSKQKQEEYYNDPVFMKRVLKDKGYFYGAFRSFYNFPNLNDFKIILVLRDPRDVLTSYYFSTLYNHPLSRKEAFEEREKYAGMPIDEFVLGQADDLNKKYTDYCNNLIGKPGVLFSKYEDMIDDFRTWLQKTSAYLELTNNEGLIDSIVNKTSFKVEKEDPKAFIRNIKAGDHKNKLKPETIEQLTRIFNDVLIKLDYAA